MTRRALLLALVALALVCEPAAATFPGRNGDIVLSHQEGSRYSNDQMSLLRFAPRFGQPREAPVCAVKSFLSPFVCQHLGRGAFAPDGGRIAVTVKEGTWAVWTLNPDGQRIARVPLDRVYSDVRWAPDESAFLAVRALEPADPEPSPQGPTGVFLLNTDGSERSLLATDASGADWCADGRIVVAQHGDIWMIDASRPGGVRRLTRQGGSDPSCSPHSRQVTFTRRDAIWTIPTKGGRARRVTTGFAPVWSPDGKQIAYLRERRALHDVETNLYRIGLRRRILRRVSEEPLMVDNPYSDESVEDPDWQPRPPG
jgi:Tol biopolymer transport system component